MTIHLRRLSALLLVGTMLLLSACTKYNFVETGLAQREYPGSMWAYFESHPYDWSMLVRLSKRLGLQSTFEGSGTYGSQITCFGITNHSWRRYLLTQYADEVTNNGGDGEAEAQRLTDDQILGLLDQLDETKAKEFILNGIIPSEAIPLESFTPGRASTNSSNPIGTGGKTYTMASGKQLWIYSFRTAFNSVPGTGPEQLFLVSASTQVTSFVASHNIRTQTGIVHSLQYNFRPTDF